MFLVMSMSGFVLVAYAFRLNNFIMTYAFTSLLREFPLVLVYFEGVMGVTHDAVFKRKA